MIKEIKPNLVIITGVGFRTSINWDEIEDIFASPFVKPNIGAFVSKILLENNYNILMISRSEKKLLKIQKSLNKYNKNKCVVEYCSMDLLEKNNYSKLMKRIKSFNKISLVHSVGLSAGNYKIHNDNPYLCIEKIPLDLPIKEYEVVIKSLLLLVKKLLPIFKTQNESRIVVISSMSGIRPFPLGFSHSSAKAGLHFATRSLALELNKYNIYVSEILPGIVDTGLYDNKEVQESVQTIGKAFGYDYELFKIPQMSPNEVANAVLLCLKSEAHILSINMVSKGQWPNLGA